MQSLSSISDASLFVLLILIVTLAAAAGNNGRSPPSCNQTCDYKVFARDAYCGGRNLTTVPQFCNDSILLDLRGNNLRALQRGQFQSFASLRFLDLSLNSLEMLPSRVFSGATQLQDIYILDNNLMSIGHDAFAETGNVRSIYLSRNYIQNLPHSVFRGLGNLKVLFLSHNSMSYIYRHQFLHNTRVTHMSFAHNQLEVILPETFMHLTKLEYLDLSFNRLHILPSVTVAGLPNFKTLIATNNSLTSDFITYDLLDSPNLEKLDLRSNLIQSIPSGLEVSHLEKLHLGENPLVCDCSLQPLQDLYITLQGEKWVAEVTCSNNNRERLVSTSLDCSPPTEANEMSSQSQDDGSGVKTLAVTKEARETDTSSMLALSIISIVIIVVCMIICFYVLVKWIWSCRSFVPTKLPNCQAHIQSDYKKLHKVGCPV